MQGKAVVAVVLVGLAAQAATPCSVFNYTWAGSTRVGRNLDWIPSSWGWVRFMQPTATGHGAMFFGADDDLWPQGGMNDQGLVLGMAATPYLPIVGNPDGLPMGEDFWELLFAQCTTVDDVLAFLAQYNLASIPGYFERGHMLWTDRFGGSVIVEGDVVLQRSGNHQIITNFLHSRPDLGGWPCARYQLIEASLAGQGAMSDAELIAVVEAAHGTLWGGYTVWSLLYDPHSLLVTVFNRGDFDRSVVLSLPDELARGVRGYLLDDLFDPAGPIFRDGFEGGDTAAWASPGASAPFEGRVRVLGLP
jgi:choloylglycine hydrolase